jgi:hypothetical protein
MCCGECERGRLVMVGLGSSLAGHTNLPGDRGRTGVVGHKRSHDIGWAARKLTFMATTVSP